MTLPLKETESVGVIEPDTEDVKLALGEKELLIEGKLEGVCEAQWVTLLL